MRTSRFVALLRGINVGGKNVIKMTELRATFEAMGSREVQTYIQSGNVVFCNAGVDKRKLAADIERTLSRTFGYDSRVVVVSAKELAEIVEQAPRGFGSAPERYRYDVLFVRAPIRAGEVLPELSVREGVDVVQAGKHALYFRRLIAKATQSHLPRLVQRAIYADITIRNWNTTTKLLTLVSAPPRPPGSQTTGART